MADVLIEQRTRILIITINRPAARNAIDAAVTAGVAAALDQLDEGKELSVGILNCGLDRRGGRPVGDHARELA